MNLAKFDELDSLLRGMLYIETTNPRECYYWSDPTDDEKCHKVPYDFSKPYPFLVRIHAVTRGSAPLSFDSLSSFFGRFRHSSNLR